MNQHSFREVNFRSPLQRHKIASGLITVLFNRRMPATLPGAWQLWIMNFAEATFFMVRINSQEGILLVGSFQSIWHILIKTLAHSSSIWSTSNAKPSLESLDVGMHFFYSKLSKKTDTLAKVPVTIGDYKKITTKWLTKPCNNPA